MMDRPLIHVACGVLVRDDGREVLIAQRPAGKLAAGKWEFPGGKIEAGETPLQALARELHEELGIEVREASPLLRFRHDYSDRCVLLDTWRVTGWEGELRAREGQAFSWLAAGRLASLDLLPTVAPIVRALRLPAHYVFTPPSAALDFLLDRLAELPHGALLRLRQPDLDDRRYAALARELLPACRNAGLGLMLDREPALVLQLGAAGWHATGTALARLEARPLDESFIIAASVHEVRQLAAAQGIGADCAVLGPVKATPTHPGNAGIGWPGFAAIRDAAALAVYAIGGVGPEDLAASRGQGAQGVAGISAYWRRDAAR
ncbi:MAG: Nudix family hydrolase [Nevskia sp.]